jgi:uncharacterized protein YqcC (DUF446 family)
VTDSIKNRIQLNLAELELAMQAADLWSSTVPSEQALTSQAPFACDTMYFEQWLQFIFIPTMRSRIASHHSLPQDCAVLPMAQESFKDRSAVNHVLSLIESCDTLLSRPKR